MFKSASTSLILRGVLATIVGILALAWPGVTILALTGVVWIAFGVVLFARPGLGAVTVAILFGLFSLISGATLISRGIDVRRAGQALHPA
jgi:uncharacterized membrane protein HdeD (DUF308 family)